MYACIVDKVSSSVSQQHEVSSPLTAPHLHGFCAEGIALTAPESKLFDACKVVDNKSETVQPITECHKPITERALAFTEGTGTRDPILLNHAAPFESEPMGDKPVTALDGITEKHGHCLARKGFDKAYTVLGQFLLLKKDKDLFVEWLNGACEAGLQEQLDCYDCLKKWCDAFL